MFDMFLILKIYATLIKARKTSSSEKVFLLF